ncbi:peptide chain release factor 1 [Sulfolobales archaeon HS-7]|nr:peptide chain release factor 1 [Sulfolobales archaeon HS-7]
MKSLIKELKKWHSPATTLLSLYIPPGRPVADVINNLRQELSISQNIKLKRTRDAVESAISGAIDRLVQISKVPQTGLALFCGENFDTNTFSCFMVIPPEKVTIYFYRTDKEYHLEFLESMVDDSDYFAVIIIENDEATIGLVKGLRVEVLEEMDTFLPRKHKMGGQSQRRMDRIHEELIHDFFKSVGERVNSYLLPYLEEGRLKGILLAGPGFAKNYFFEGDYMDYRLKKIVMQPLIDVGYQGEGGIREVLVKAGDMLKGQKYIEVTKVLEEIKYHLAKGDSNVVYGIEEIKKALDMGAIEKLVIYEGNKELEKLGDEAKKKGATVFYVNDELPEADWVQQTFQGAIGLLRFKY